MSADPGTSSLDQVPGPPPSTPVGLSGQEQIAKGFAWTAFFSLISKVAFPLAGLYVSRTLGSTIIGIASLLQMTLMISEVVRDGGLTQTYLADTELTEPRRAAYQGLSLLTGAVPAVVVLLMTPTLARFFGVPQLVWSFPVVALCLLLNGASTIPNSELLRKGKLKVQGSIGVVSGGVALASTVLLVRLGVGFPALVLQMFLNSLIGIVLILRYEPLSHVRFEPVLVREAFARSKVLLATNIANNLFIFCDIFVIQRLVGTSAAGYYNAAQNIAYKPADLFVFPLSKTLLVAFSNASGDLPRLRRAYGRALVAVVALIFPIYPFLAFNADAVVRILLTSKFDGSIPVLSALCVYLAFRTVGNISGNALVPAGKHRLTIYPWYVAVLFTAAGVVVIARWHTALMDVVWLFTLGAMLAYGWLFALALRFVAPPAEQWRKLGRVALVTTATGLGLWGLTFLHVHPFVRFAIGIATVPVVHVLLLGAALSGSPFAYLSKQGPKRLLGDL